MTRTCGHEIFTAMVKPVWKLPEKSEPITVRVRAHLVKTAKQGVLITYGNLANAVDLSPPHRIHQLTEALEFLMEEDAAARRPFIAALAISKRRGGFQHLASLTAPGAWDGTRVKTTIPRRSRITRGNPMPPMHSGPSLVSPHFSYPRFVSLYSPFLR